MTAMLEPVSDADLDAYVDDQLDVARRIEVEAFLSMRPESAARIMSDLRTRDELRLALAGSKGMARPETGDAARRLERGLARGRMFAVFQRAATIAVFVAAGWLASGIFGPLSVTKVVASTQPPAYVEEAMRAHETSIVRSSMASQPEMAKYDPDEIRASTAIVMPTLPPDWKISDVQIYPSRFGPSVEMTLNTEEFGRVSLFAVRPGTFDVVKPTVAPSGNVSSAYFQIGEVAYALVARGGIGDLDHAARQLADTLY